MTADPLDPTKRYNPVGLRKFYWVPTIANKAAPTRTELDAGTDLTAEIVQDSIQGFSLDNGAIDVPDAGTDFTSQVPGNSTAADSGFAVYLSDDSDDARTLLVKGLRGFMVIFPEGDVEDHKMDVWPVRIRSASKDPDMTKGGQMMVGFAITSKPVEDIDVPADT